MLLSFYLFEGLGNADVFLLTYLSFIYWNYENEQKKMSVLNHICLSTSLK